MEALHDQNSLDSFGSSCISEHEKQEISAVLDIELKLKLFVFLTRWHLFLKA